MVGDMLGNETKELGLKKWRGRGRSAVSLAASLAGGSCGFPGSTFWSWRLG